MTEAKEIPFEKWLAEEGIPVLRGHAVADLWQVSLTPWPRKGGSGAHILLKGSEGWISAYLCQIAPKNSLKPQQHLFEQQIFILQGQGETEIWNSQGSHQAIQWQKIAFHHLPLIHGMCTAILAQRLP